MKTPSNLSLSRRRLLRALGATAITQLPGFGADPSATASPPKLPEGRLINGYTGRQSYRPGERVTLFLSSSVPGRAELHLYDYQGAPVFPFTAELTPQEPLAPNPWERGFGYEATAVFTLPELASGVYWVERFIPVIVKTAPAKYAEVVILYPSNTLAAYNTAGGKSMYSTRTRRQWCPFIGRHGPPTIPRLFTRSSGGSRACAYPIHSATSLTWTLRITPRSTGQAARSDRS